MGRFTHQSHEIISRVVFKGLTNRKASAFESTDWVMSGYELVKGKQYDVWRTMDYTLLLRTMDMVTQRI